MFVAAHSKVLLVNMKVRKWNFLVGNCQVSVVYTETCVTPPPDFGKLFAECTILFGVSLPTQVFLDSPEVTKVFSSTMENYNWPFQKIVGYVFDTWWYASNMLGGLFFSKVEFPFLFGRHVGAQRQRIITKGLLLYWFTIRTGLDVENKAWAFGIFCISKVQI